MFPVLLPAIEQMLKAAKENKVFEVCPIILFIDVVYLVLMCSASDV